jgi:hypothetical protein
MKLRVVCLDIGQGMRRSTSVETITADPSGSDRGLAVDYRGQCTKFTGIGPLNYGEGSLD